MTPMQAGIRKEEIKLKVTESGKEFDKYAEEMLSCLETPARVSWDAVAGLADIKATINVHLQSIYDF